MADQSRGEHVGGQTSGAIPELVSGYQSARLQVAISAGLLILWWAGILFEGTIPVLGVKIPTSEKLGYVLFAVLSYSVVRLVIEWFQSDPERRRRLISRIDLALTLSIAIGTAYLTWPALLASVPLPPLRVVFPLAALTVLGFFAGFVTAGLLKTLVFIRSKEQASRLALPRYPVVTRAMFQSWWRTMLLLLVAVVLTPGFAAPLSHLWLWFLGAPLAIPIVLEAIRLSRPKERAFLRTLQSAIDQHDTHYQHGGWDRKIASNDTPLYIAAETDQLDRVQQLLDSGAKPNQINMHGWTPLMIAVAQRHEAVARLLLQRGANPDVANFLGRTPLMFASRYGLVNLVRDLIAAGADVNLNRSSDAGALAIAALEGHRDVVNLLLEAGADPAAKDRTGRTALDLAQDGGHGEIAAILRRRTRQQPG